jgi:hypothetical protein
LPVTIKAVPVALTLINWTRGEAANSMPPIESESVEIAAEIVGETDRAVLLSAGTRKVWLPKNLVAWDAQTRTAKMPIWLAREKRLR